MPCTLSQDQLPYACPALFTRLWGQTMPGHAFQVTVCLRALYADTDSGRDMEPR